MIFRKKIAQIELNRIKMILEAYSKELYSHGRWHRNTCRTCIDMKKEMSKWVSILEESRQ